MGGGDGKDHFPSALEGMGSLEEEVQASEERVLPAADGFVLGREPRLALGGREAAGDRNRVVMRSEGQSCPEARCLQPNRKTAERGKMQLAESRPQHPQQGVER